MSATTLERVSPAEYLEAERKSETKHEYIDGIIIPTSGASLAHTIICSNINALIWFFIKNRELTVHSNDLKVSSPKTQGYFYPDLAVVKGEAKLTDEYKDIITNPYLIVEVLLESTEGYDRGDKFQAYRSIESLQEYVLVSQDKPHVEVFTHNTTDDTWLLTEVIGMEHAIRLHTLNFDLSLAAVYAKVKFTN